jgi:hypothetical protein
LVDDCPRKTLNLLFEPLDDQVLLLSFEEFIVPLAIQLGDLRLACFSKAIFHHKIRNGVVLIEGLGRVVR